jgi:LPS O-antigen subunit length determinant protein (WzzB/FepE family)
MNENKNEQVIPAQVPQIIYGYPSQISREDEIDLGELLVKLMKQTKLMLAIVIVGTLLSVVVALFLPNIYQQEVILSVPKSSNIVELNLNSSLEHTPISIFKEYYEYLRSPKELNSFINNNGYLNKLYPDDIKDPNALIEEFEEKFTIFVLEPAPKIKGGQVKFPERVSIKAEGEQESVIVEILNNYILYIEEKLIQDLVKEQRIQINSELKSLDKDIAYSRSSTKLDRLNEIVRLENKNREKIADLNSQIDSLVLKVDLDKKSQLLALKEAHATAKNLNIDKPTTLKKLSSDGGDKSDTTEINLGDEKDLPLYLMGTNFIQIKISELEKRAPADDLAFNEEYSQLKKSINLLENDAALKELKERKNDDPYIEILPELLQKKDRLEELSLNFDNTKVTRVEKYAKVTGKKIKPKRSLIVVLGGVISCIVALFVGIIFLLVGNKKVNV